MEKLLDINGGERINSPSKCAYTAGFNTPISNFMSFMNRKNRCKIPEHLNLWWQNRDFIYDFLNGVRAMNDELYVVQKLPPSNN